MGTTVATNALLERKGDTVDFIKGVREMSQMDTLDGRCGRILFCLTEPTVDLLAQIPSHGKLRKGDEIGGQQGI